jgi:hypothetical protein
MISAQDTMNVTRFIIPLPPEAKLIPLGPRWMPHLTLVIWNGMVPILNGAFTRASGTEVLSCRGI